MAKDFAEWYKRKVASDPTYKASVAARQAALYHKNQRTRPGFEAAKKRVYRFNTRTRVLEHYSGGPAKCACCGENHRQFLTIDHINGGGGAHRKALNLRGHGFYEWLVRENFPKDFRVLCYNCNSGRKVGLCPHESDRP